MRVYNSNADNIRSMNDEELEDFLWRFRLANVAREDEHLVTKKKLGEWLREPVKEKQNNHFKR